MRERATIVERIERKFGSQARLCDATGLAQPTVAQWKRRGGRVPARHQPVILRAGRDLPDPVTPADFFEPAELSEAAA